MTKERCYFCDNRTGKKKNEDSFYCEGCKTGPLCQRCWDKHMKSCTYHFEANKRPLIPLIDCKSIFDRIMKEASDIKSDYPAKIVAIVPTDDVAANSYYGRIRKYGNQIGVTVKKYKMPTQVKKLNSKIVKLNNDNSVNGIILISEPPEFYESRSLIDTNKNVEGTDCADNVDQVFCTARACLEIIKSLINIEGKTITVVGYGKRVGKPLSYLLMRAHAGSVITTHKYTPDLMKYTARSHVIVTAVGKPGIITPQMINHGTIMIDAGIAKDPVSNKIVGDVRKDVQEVAPVTPVPGGVGPVTCAILLRNLAINVRKMING